MNRCRIPLLDSVNVGFFTFANDAVQAFQYISASGILIVSFFVNFPIGANWGGEDYSPLLLFHLPHSSNDKIFCSPSQITNGTNNPEVILVLEKGAAQTPLLSR